MREKKKIDILERRRNVPERIFFIVAFAVLAITAFSVLWYSKWSGSLLILLGVVLYLPGLRYVARYLIKGGMEQWNFPLTSMMPKG